MVSPCTLSSRWFRRSSVDSHGALSLSLCVLRSCIHVACVQASLAAFDAEFVQTVDMQEYVLNLQRATSTLEKSMPLPPLGEHVTYLQNALVSSSVREVPHNVGV